MSGSGARDGSGDRYGLVFALLIVGYVLSAVEDALRVQALALLLRLAALLVAVRTARLPSRVARRLRRPLTVGTLGAVVVGAVVAGPAAVVVVALWAAVVMVVTLGVVVWRILHHRLVSLATVFGALSAYLLIGGVFAALFAAVGSRTEEAFFAGGQPLSAANLQYFSLVTLTTTGYGDLTAATSAGRMLASMEALLGQIFLVTLVARLVALYGTTRPGVPDPTDPTDPTAPAARPAPEAEAKAELEADADADEDAE